MSLAPDASTAAQLAHFVRCMPKVELHLHVEGAVRPETLLQLARRHAVALPAADVAGLREWCRYASFSQFVQVWLAVTSCLRDSADFARIVRELGESLARQHVLYAEPTFSPATHLTHNGVPYDAVWDGIRDGALSAEREFGVHMRFSVDIPRNRRPGEGGAVEATADWAIAHRHEGIVALGLGGVEDGNPPELFADAFRCAKAHGLRSRPHAGETVGAASVWGALRALGADRIAHGVRALEDPALISHLAAHGIACDVCPTSNVRLGIYASMAQHPIRRLLAAGVPVTLSTDNPALFDTTLTGELLALAEEHSFTADELAALVRAGVEATFLPAPDKTALRARVATGLAAAARDAGIELE